MVSRYQNVIKDLTKNINLSLAIYERLNSYCTILYDERFYSQVFSELNGIRHTYKSTIPWRSKFVTNYEKVIANEKPRNDFVEAVLYECRCVLIMLVLLKIGKPDFLPMKAALLLFERLEYGWMHSRISPHRSNVLTTPLRLS